MAAASGSLGNSSLLGMDLVLLVCVLQHHVGWFEING